MKILLAFLALVAPAAAFAGDSVSLDSQVFVERVKEDAEGRKSIVLEPPAVVTPGDRLLFVLNYRNQGTQPASGFVLTNPIPQAVAFSAAEGGSEIVSVDGGKNWGALASLKIVAADGSVRPAAPADVTHVRWSFAQAIAPGGAGKLSFRGVVR